MKRSDGELVRAKQHLRSLRALLESIELVLNDPDPPGYVGQGLVMEAYNLAQCISRLDAYRRAEADLSEDRSLYFAGPSVQEIAATRTTKPKPVCDSCHDTHEVHNNGRGVTVMCTRCPVPCRTCATDNGRGAYCASTPCACSCHKNKRGKL